MLIQICKLQIIKLIIFKLQVITSATGTKQWQYQSQMWIDDNQTPIHRGEIIIEK